MTAVVMRACSFVAIGLLVGCAEMRWSKPGVDPSRMEEDLAQCRAEAHLQASRVSLPRTSGLPSPGLGTDPAGRPVPAPSRSRTEDPMLLEQDLTGSCMRGKGYALAPVERP